MSARDGHGRGIALVAGVALTVALALYLSYRNRDFQFDDGLIYQRYVRNWLDGAGLVYNRGERFNGLTSPFYSYLVMATAAVMRGSVADGIAVLPPGNRKAVSVEHPTGEFTVELELDPQHPQNVLRAALLRTARLIMRGEVLIPHAVWDGRSALRRAA